MTDISAELAQKIKQLTEQEAKEKDQPPPTPKGKKTKAKQAAAMSAVAHAPDEDAERAKAAQQETEKLVACLQKSKADTFKELFTILQEKTKAMEADVAEVLKCVKKWDPSNPTNKDLGVREVHSVLINAYNSRVLQYYNDVQSFVGLCEDCIQLGQPFDPARFSQRMRASMQQAHMLANGPLRALGRAGGPAESEQ